MEKPKEEYSEEEKKMAKEFEKKAAIFLEEQEKHRKALETELRKLQSSIVEIQEQFDSKLQDFFNFKLNVDKQIYQMEVQMVKQTAYAMLFDSDNQIVQFALFRSWIYSKNWKF